MLLVKSWLYCAAFAILISGVGCTHQQHYHYSPIPHGGVSASAARRGLVFPVERGNSRGQLRLYSLGVVPLKSPSKKGESSAILVRVAITNGGAKGWKVDAREQRLGFDDSQGFEPIAVNTDRAKPPFSEVAPQETQVFDLYFDLANHKGEEDLPGFVFQWVIHTPEGIIGKTVTFVRGITNDNGPLEKGESAEPARYMDPDPWGTQWWDQPERVPSKPFLHF